MLKRTPFHSRTAALMQAEQWRRWAGYTAASAYEMTHDREYLALRNACVLIDVSPLCKYQITGLDALRFLNRLVTRDVGKCPIGGMLYTPWCNSRGQVIDDGTIAHLGDHSYRLTSAEPNLRWLQDNAIGMRVQIEEVSEQIATLALQGPRARELLMTLTDAPLTDLKYYRFVNTQIADTPVMISRTGYTGDLGYEIWMPWDRAIDVWDALMTGGRPFDVQPAGMLALDVARVEAGLLLIDVDFHSSKKALIAPQKYTPYEMGLGRLVELDTRPFVGRAALAGEHQRGSARQIVGLDISWPAVEKLFDDLGLAPQIPAAASRTAVPVYDALRGGHQIGRATTTTWSPVLKKLIALATIDKPYYAPGTPVHVEITVEAVRHRVPALVAKTPFFNPPRKTATPPW